MYRNFLLGAALVVSNAPSAQAQVFASLVLVHGHIWTENPAQPEADAVAINGNRIVQAGSSDDILRLAGPATRVIDLKGRRVLPGFNDAHVHFIDGGLGLAGVQLRTAASQDELRQRIAAFAGSQPEGVWIVDG